MKIFLILMMFICVIINAQTYKVGAFNNFPVIFKDTDGSIKGLYVDLLTEISKKENIKFEYVFGTWTDSLDRIKSGEVDLLTSVGLTEERKLFMDYCEKPLLTVWAELYALPSSDIDSILKIGGKKIGVMINDINAANFASLTSKFSIKYKSKEYISYEEIFKAIVAQEVDAGVAGVTFGATRQSEFGLKSTGIVFNPMDIFFTVAKNKNKNLTLLLDKYLNQWHSQKVSIFSQARQKWLYGSVGTVAVAPTWVRDVLIVLAAIITLSFIFITVLRSRIKKATDALNKNQILLNETSKMAKIGGWETVIGKKENVWTDVLYDIYEVEKSFIPTIEETLKFLTPESQEKIIQARKIAMETGQSYDCELQLTTAKGTHKWVRNIGRVSYHNGKIVGRIGVLQDITKRKQNELSLQRAAQVQIVLRKITEATVKSTSIEDLYKIVHRLIETILPAKLFHINILDKKTNEIVVPYRADDVNTIPARRPVDKGLTEYIMKLGRAIYIAPEQLNRLRETGDYTLYNAQNVRVRHYLGAPLIDSKGESFGVMSLILMGEDQVISQDDVEVFSIIATQVSMAIERKNAEKLLTTSETKYRTLFETAKDGILILDAETAMIVDVNPFIKDIIGYSHEQLLGKTVWDIGFLKDVIENKEKFLELQQKKYVRYHDLPLETINGNVVHVEFVSNVYLVGDKKVIQCNIRDISDRVEALDEIKILSRFPEENPNPVMRISKEGAIVYSNTASKSILDHWDVVDQKIPKEHYSFALKAFKDGHPNRMEFECGNKTFTALYVPILTPILEENYLNIYATDITDRKQAENALQESEEKFSTAFKTSPYSITITQVKDGKFVEVNDAFFTMTGYTPEEVSSSINMNLWAHEKDRSEVLNDLKNNKAVVGKEFEFKKKDGTIIVGSFSANIVTIKNETFILSIINDITDKKQVENALQESEERLKVTLESIGDGVIATDENLNITVMNEQATKIMGVSAVEAIGKKLPEVVSLENINSEKFSIEDLAEQVLTTGKTIYISRAEYKNKTKLEIDLSIIEDSISSIKNSSGSIYGLVIVFRDITDKVINEEKTKKLEQQLYHSQKMDAIGQFSSGVAHDFNNIVTAINGNCDLAVNVLDEPEELSDCIKNIKIAALRATQLSKKILSFGKDQTIEKTTIVIDEFIEGEMILLEKMISEEIEIKCNLNCKSKTIEADSGQLNSVFMNLIANAAHAILENNSTEKEIIVETNFVSVDVDIIQNHYGLKIGDYVVISVSDNGAGMSKEILSKIFNPFFTTRKEKGGTGLGLSTVYSILDQNNAKIYVYSEVNEGTIFKIFWPHSIKSKTEKHETSVTYIDNKNIRILFVEDELNLLTVAVKYINKLGYNVSKAINGEEALKVDLTKIDLIITDVIMPKMGGDELAIKARAINPTIKIIFTSGYSYSHHSNLLKDKTEFLSKPYSLKDIENKIHSILKK